MNELEKRVAEVEKQLTQIIIARAAEAVLLSNLDKRLASIEQSMIWLNRSVYGGIVLAILAFIVKGGLNI